jgi:hypothetical protein|tara:strand:- start:2873 stop:3040 length:168 start_codon:yes stop_codon:yes gene_type:complete
MTDQEKRVDELEKLRCKLVEVRIRTHILGLVRCTALLDNVIERLTKLSNLSGDDQ